MDAHDGWAAANGVKKEQSNKLTPDDVRELKDWMDEKNG
jgi:hypothetical protein